MLARFKEPHCPQCKGKPTNGQSALTDSERAKLTGRTGKMAREANGLVGRCHECGAMYSFRDGFSSILSY